VFSSALDQGCVVSYYRMCSLTVECVLFCSGPGLRGGVCDERVPSYYRMCSLTVKCALLRHNVFACCRMCSGVCDECVPSVAADDASKWNAKKPAIDALKASPMWDRSRLLSLGRLLCECGVAEEI